AVSPRERPRPDASITLRRWRDSRPAAHDASGAEARQVIGIAPVERDAKEPHPYDFTTHTPQALARRAPGARVFEHSWAKKALATGASVRYFGLCHAGDPDKVASDAWAHKWGLTQDLEAIESSRDLALIETPAYK